MARILVVTWAGGGNVPPALTLATAARRRAATTCGPSAPSRSRPGSSPSGIPYVARELLTEWDPAVAGARRARRGPQGRPRGRPTTCSRPALSAGEAAGVPGRGARAHALRRQPRRLRRAAPDGDGDLDRLARHRPSRARRAAGGDLRRAARPVRQRAGDVPGVARPPVARPARPRPLRRAAARAAGPRRRRGDRPGVDDGRPLVVAGLGTTPMDELPVLQRVVTALGAAPVRGIVTLGDHLDPADLDVPAGVQLSGYVRHAAMLPWASAVVTHAGLGTVLAGLAHGLPAGVPPARARAARQRRRGRAGRRGRRARRGVVAGCHRRGDRPRGHRPRAARRRGADGASRSTSSCGPAGRGAEVERLPLSRRLPCSSDGPARAGALLHGAGGRPLRAAALVRCARSRALRPVRAPLGRAGARARLRRRRPAARPAGARPRRRRARRVARHARPLPGQRGRPRPGRHAARVDHGVDGAAPPLPLDLPGRPVLQPAHRRRHGVAGPGPHPRAPRARRLGADPAVRARAGAAPE